MIDSIRAINKVVPGKGFLIWWLIVNMITNDLVIIWAAVLTLISVLFGGSFNFFLFFLLGLTGMAFIGAGQWVVVRRYLDNPQMWFLAFLPAVIVGVLSAYIILVVLNLLNLGWFESLIMSIVFCQAVAGLLHGILLSRQNSSSGWLSYPLATSIGAIGNFLWGSWVWQWSNSVTNANPVIVLAIILAAVMAGAPYAFLTGLSLKWLLNRRV